MRDIVKKINSAHQRLKKAPVQANISEKSQSHPDGKMSILIFGSSWHFPIWIKTSVIQSMSGKSGLQSTTSGQFKSVGKPKLWVGISLFRFSASLAFSKVHLDGGTMTNISFTSDKMVWFNWEKALPKVKLKILVQNHIIQDCAVGFHVPVWEMFSTKIWILILSLWRGRLDLRPSKA